MWGLLLNPDAVQNGLHNQLFWGAKRTTQPTRTCRTSGAALTGSDLEVLGSQSAGTTSGTWLRPSASRRLLGPPEARPSWGLAAGAALEGGCRRATAVLLPPPAFRCLGQRCACQRSLLIRAPIQGQTADQREEMETTEATLTAIDRLKLAKVCLYSSVTPDQPNPCLLQLTSKAKHLKLCHWDQREHPYSFTNPS